MGVLTVVDNSDTNPISGTGYGAGIQLRSPCPNPSEVTPEWLPGKMDEPKCCTTPALTVVTNQTVRDQVEDYCDEIKLESAVAWGTEYPTEQNCGEKWLLDSGRTYDVCLNEEGCSQDDAKYKYCHSSYYCNYGGVCSTVNVWYREDGCFDHVRCIPDHQKWKVQAPRTIIRNHEIGYLNNLNFMLKEAKEKLTHLVSRPLTDAGLKARDAAQEAINGIQQLRDDSL